ncbi:hypothetical protein [Acinetobacter sp. ANC 4640]
MDNNNPIVTPNARHVSGRCLLNDIEVPFVSFDVDNNSMNAADTFSLTLATSALPPDMSLMKWWAEQTKITVKIFVSITTAAGKDEKQLIVGHVDNLHYHPARFEITLDGRDFTGLMIDYKSSGESYKNYTPSQIATMIAKDHGLNPVVTPFNKYRFGEFMNSDVSHLTGEQTDWDLLCNIAGFINYRVYVEGYDLHFEPMPPDPTEKTADQYVIRYVPKGSISSPQANVSDDLQFERNLSITKGLTVEVKSWQIKRKSQKQFTASFPLNVAKGTKPGESKSKSKIYRIIRQGLTPQAAAELAQSTFQQISKHEMKMSGSTGGDNILNSKMMIRVEGTNSPFDQLYYCDSIRRSLAWDTGYTMTIHAKNRSPLLEVFG